MEPDSIRQESLLVTPRQSYTDRRPSRSRSSRLYIFAPKSSASPPSTTITPGRWSTTSGAVAGSGVPDPDQSSSSSQNSWLSVVPRGPDGAGRSRLQFPGAKAVSSPRPPGPQPGALPAELRPPRGGLNLPAGCWAPPASEAPRAGFEPAT